MCAGPERDIPRERLDALFTLQLVAVTALSLLLLALAPAVALLTGVPGTGWLTASLAGALFLLSLRSLPSAMQERDLAYGAPVLADLVSQVSYWLLAVTLAWLGWGVWSVVWSVLLSSALGTLALLLKTRWRPRLNFNWRGLRNDSVFGLMIRQPVFIPRRSNTPSCRGWEARCTAAWSSAT